MTGFPPFNFEIKLKHSTFVNGHGIMQKCIAI